MDRTLQKLLSLAVVISMLAQVLAMPLATVAAPAGAVAPTAAITSNVGAERPMSAVPAASFMPAAMGQALSVSRVQSNYEVSGALTITYTVTNNRPPTLFPDITPGATMTETVAATAGFDSGRDPNTVRGVLLTTTLAGATAFERAEPAADGHGAQLAWSLGDIAPMTSKQVALRVQAPAAGAQAFVALDEGAAAWGLLQGRAVQATAAPALAVAENLQQWLVWTVDADIYDEEMLRQAAEAGQTAEALFAFVQGLAFESYSGSLRGTRGALWSEAGNSVDQASLLVAMLRAAGVPARYRHGALTTAQAQQLIGGMFEPSPRMAGQTPAAAEASDPLNDPTLLAETRDHWWVEAYLPNQGWQDMDPVFGGAAIGQRFAEPLQDGTDRVAELPASLRHTISMRLRVEDYHPLNVGSGGLSSSYPFEAAFYAVEAAAQPVSLAHLVVSENQGGLVFGNAIHTYTPYILVGEREIMGEPYQELFSNFPLGTRMLTGAWVEMTLTAPDGAQQQYERELKDRIGVEKRLSGGSMEMPLSGDTPLYTDFDMLAMGFWPNFVPEEARMRAQAAAMETAQTFSADGQQLLALRERESLTAAEQDALRAIRVRYQLNMSRFLANVALSFADAADRMTRDLSATSFVKAYYDAPRLIITGSQVASDDTGEFTLDLRRTLVRAIAHPGQDKRAEIGFNMARGVVESGIEGAVLETVLGVRPVTTARLFEAAHEQEIFPLVISADNLATLETMAISEQGKARITRAALAGKLIHVPHQAVLLDGEAQTGWWEIDPLTGETIGVMENGLHLAALEYVITIGLSAISGPLLDFMLGFTAYTWGFVANHVDKAIGDGTFDQDSYNWWIGAWGTSLTCLSAIVNPDIYGGLSCGGGVVGAATGLTLDYFGAGQKAAEVYLNSVVQHDPPLPDYWVGPALGAAATQSEASREIEVDAIYPPGALAVDVATSHVAFAGGVESSWQTPGTGAFPFATLDVAEGTLRDGDGALLANGAVAVEALGDGATTGSGAATANGAANVAVNGEGQTAFYAPALAGLGASGQWRSYSAQLNQSGELALQGALATVEGVPYAGDLRLESSGVASLSGSGAGAAPNFVGEHSATLADAVVVVGPKDGAAGGAVTANGMAVQADNGLALLGYDESVSLIAEGAAATRVSLLDTVQFFTLNLSATEGAGGPQQAVSFVAEVGANFDGAFVLTAAAPDGWDVGIDAGGAVTVQPAPGAAEGEYAILVTAQAEHALATVAAVYTATITAHEGLALTVQPDPLYTTPMGPVLDAQRPAGDTNTGQAQIPGAAYTIVVTNTANAPRTVDLSVSGLPAGWTLLSSGAGASATLALAAGEVGLVGLYVNAGQTLPPPGTTYGFLVSAQSETGQTATDGATFTMPAVPFSMVTVTPQQLYSGPNTTVDVTVAVRNVGNAPASFALSSRAVSDLLQVVSEPDAPGTLAVGEQSSQTVTLAVGDAPLGQTFPLLFDSPAPGSIYTQTASLLVTVASEKTGALLEIAGNSCVQELPQLAAAVQTLAQAVEALEASCSGGGCAPLLRDQTVTALQDAAQAAAQASPLFTASATLETLATELSGQSDEAAITATLAAIVPAVATLGDEACQLAAHDVRLSWSPVFGAALVGETAPYELTLHNRGSQETTYAITLTLPSGVTVLTETVAAGATLVTPLDVTENNVGLYRLTAEAVATGPGITLNGLGAQAEARLNVVERYVQVTAVTADPDFVESGVGETTVSVQVANVANVARPATARLEILDATNSVRRDYDIPLTLLAGAPRSYELVTVDTTGWEAGVYTLSVSLVDEAYAPIADGAGTGYLSVGQGVQAAHSVWPQVVAPGTVTVSTQITTTLSPGLMDGMQAPDGAPQARGIYGMPLWEQAAEAGEAAIDDMRPAPEGEGPTAVDAGWSVGDAEAAEEPPGPAAAQAAPIDAWLSAPDVASGEEAETAPAEGAEVVASPMATITIGDGFARTEESDAAVVYTGSWSDVSLNAASGGAYRRSATAGSSAALTFDGSWVQVGFVADHFGGDVEIFLDGESQGVVDLYRREATRLALRYEGLLEATHTISMTVLGTSNPFSNNRRVQLDYFDAGNSAPQDAGSFEQDSARVILSNGWTAVSDAAASGGSYVRSNNGTAWIPFDGDSFAYHAIAYSSGGKAQLSVDGRYLDTVNLHSSSTVSRTFAYDGFGPGPHLLQVASYRGNVTVDGFTVPGTGPFVDPDPPVVGVTRYEEEYPGIRYNGLPYTQTAQSWVREGAARASDGQIMRSQTAGDTVTFDFEGSWLGVGFVTDRFSGQAEIAVDGVALATVELYTRETDVESRYFDNLGEGPHTLTVTVLGMRHPHALNQRVMLDYIDVWDGQPLADGVFEETSERFYLSDGWGRATAAMASGGGYGNGSSGATAWLPFSGSSVTLETWARNNLHSLEVKIDGVSQGMFPTYAFEESARPFTFEGLGEGAHVMEIRGYRGNVTVDAVVTPATGANYEIPAPRGVIRYEEDHPTMRYNGYPPRQMPTSWSIGSTLSTTSGQYRASTGATGDTLAFDFEGPWVHVGFENSTGEVEFFIDGVPRGLYNPQDGAGGVNSIAFDDLGPGSHTITMTLRSGSMRPDYIDVWDGQPVEDGWYNGDLEDFSGRFHFSNKGWWWKGSNSSSYEGDYLTQSVINANPNMWFTFVGNDLTLLSLNRANSLLDISIDGVEVGTYDMTAEFSNQPTTLHFGDLGHGPHVVTVSTRAHGRVDAFEVNPDGFYSYVPTVSWWDSSAQDDLGAGYGTGFLSSIALGDLQGDGVVELVAPARNGRLYVYRGDGLDAGDGTPVLWSSDLPGPAAEPALADITGDGNADIVVTGYNGAFAFRHDGLLLWQQPDVKSWYSDGGGIYGWNGAAIGNLDGAGAPEIVIAAWDDALYVLDNDGNVLDSVPVGPRVTSPLLADITGDGLLDIIVAEGHTLSVYTFDATDGLQLAWDYTLAETTVRSGTYGSPAVADLDGDGSPEIIINWGPRIEALTAGGDLLWSSYMGSDSYYYPSPVTVGDATGDGQVNIITASAIHGGFWVNGHNLMVLDATGELVWEQVLDDSTSSASGVAAQDLDGDGVWEILWNGAGDGFVIMRGSDGKRLFNEPFTASGTIIDYPSLGDVDGDGVADVVTAGRNGIFVISHVGHWTDSRPMWNQHTYHVTNINDNWSVPLHEPDSWEVHNTYRTQTPERNPAPSYRIEVTHTVGLDGVTPLAGSFAPPPQTTTTDAYGWVYQLDQYDGDETIQFESELAQMAPGETRQVNAGTEVVYELPSGWNRLTLPPLYVTAARMAALAPETQTVGAGGTVTYTVTLTNAATTPDVYSLEVVGLPPGWAAEMAAVNVPPQSSVDAALVVQAAVDAEPAVLPFMVAVENGSGGRDQAHATLEVATLLEATLQPPAATAAVGQPVTYTLTVSNHGATEQSYALSAWGMAQVTLPPAVTVGAGESVDVAVQARAEKRGPHTFVVQAAAPGAAAQASGVHHATGSGAAALSLQPDPAVAGPGMAAEMTLTVTNLGDVQDSYALALALPAGWSYTLAANGAAVEELTLAPKQFNSATLDLLVRPPATATPGSYVITATAASLAHAEVQATTTGTVEVRERGVQVEIAPQETALSTTDAGSWQVTITNTGQIADSYWLTATGVVALSAAFSPSSVALGPGQSTTVNMSAGNFDFALPQRYAFSVMAVSEAEAQVRAQDTAAVTFEPQEAVQVRWLPATQTVTDTLQALFVLEVSNTGNRQTTFDLALEAPGLYGALPHSLLELPAKATAQLPVVVRAAGPGVYTLQGVASSGAAAQDADTATLTMVWTNEPPLVDAGSDMEADEGETVTFAGSASDPEGDPLTILWEFGDGASASGTLTPQHSYADDGVYEVRLTASDGNATRSDTLLVTVHNVAPQVDAGPDVTADVGQTVTFHGSFVDPGVEDTHTILWEFGDGRTASGTLTPSRSFAQAGVYTVRLTVTDDDGGVGTDTLTVTVLEEAPEPAFDTLFIPAFFGG